MYGSSRTGFSRLRHIASSRRIRPRTTIILVGLLIGLLSWPPGATLARPGGGGGYHSSSQSSSSSHSSSYRPSSFGTSSSPPRSGPGPATHTTPGDGGSRLVPVSTFNQVSTCDAAVDLVHVLNVAPRPDGSLDVFEALVAGRLGEDGRPQRSATEALPDCLKRAPLLPFPWYSAPNQAFAVPVAIRGHLPLELARLTRQGSAPAVAEYGSDDGLLRDDGMVAVHYYAYGAYDLKSGFPHAPMEHPEADRQPFDWSLSVFHFPTKAVRSVYASFTPLPGTRREPGVLCALPLTGRDPDPAKSQCAPLEPSGHGGLAAGLRLEGDLLRLASLGGVLVGPPPEVPPSKEIPAEGFYELAVLDDVQLDLHIDAQGHGQADWTLTRAAAPGQLWPMPISSTPCPVSAPDALKGSPLPPALAASFKPLDGCFDPRQPRTLELRSILSSEVTLLDERVRLEIPSPSDTLRARHFKMRMRIDGATDLQVGRSGSKLTCIAQGPELNCTGSKDRCNRGASCDLTLPNLHFDLLRAGLLGWKEYERLETLERHDRYLVWGGFLGLPLLLIGGAAWLLLREEKWRMKKVEGESAPEFEALEARMLEMRAANTEKELARWTGDGRLDLPALLELQRQVAERFNGAWCSSRMEPMRSLLSGGVYNRSRVQLALQKREGIGEEMLDWRLVDARVVGLEQQGPWQVAHVAMVAQARNVEYELAERDDPRAMQAKRGETPLEGYLEVWSFVRKTPKAGGAERHAWEGNCPRCGSATDRPGEYNRCPACDAIYSSGEHDWVLAEITQEVEWEAREGGPEGRGQVGARGRPLEAVDGPGESSAAPRQYLEDRASLLFWKWAEAMMFARTAVVSRFATDRFLEQLEHDSSSILQLLKADVGRTDPVGLKELSRFIVGAVETVQSTPAPHPNRARVAIKLNACLAGSWWWAKLELDLIRKSGDESGYGFGDIGCNACGAPLPEVEADACNRCGVALEEKIDDWLLDGVRVLQHEARR